MANQVDVLPRLKAHDAKHRAILFESPERYPRGNVASEVNMRHIGLVPTVCRNHSAIRLGSGIHDREDGGDFIMTTGADGVHGEEVSAGCRYPSCIKVALFSRRCVHSGVE